MIDTINNILVNLFGTSKLIISFGSSELFSIDLGTLISYLLISLALIVIAFLGYFVVNFVIHMRS